MSRPGSTVSSSTEGMRVCVYACMRLHDVPLSIRVPVCVCVCVCACMRVLMNA
jgi:hypothetical protein